MLLVVAMTSRLRTLNVNIRILNSGEVDDGIARPALVDDEPDDGGDEAERHARPGGRAPMIVGAPSVEEQGQQRR